MDTANFYLASAAVIPILSLVEAVRRTVWITLHSASAVHVARTTIGRVRIVSAIWTIAEVGLFAWAEFVCLRTLEIGKPALGGAHVVWIALIYGVINLSLIRLGSKMDEEDIRAVFAKMERRGVFGQHVGQEHRDPPPVD